MCADTHLQRTANETTRQRKTWTRFFFVDTTTSMWKTKWVLYSIEFISLNGLSLQWLIASWLDGIVLSFIFCSFDALDLQNFNICLCSRYLCEFSLRDANDGIKTVREIAKEKMFFVQFYRAFWRSVSNKFEGHFWFISILGYQKNWSDEHIIMDLIFFFQFNWNHFSPHTHTLHTLTLSMQYAHV